MKAYARAHADREQSSLAGMGLAKRTGARVVSVDHRPSVAIQAKFTVSLQASAPLVSQRQQLGRLFGPSAQLQADSEEELQKKTDPSAKPCMQRERLGPRQACIAQRKKTTQPADSELVTEFETSVPSSVLSGKTIDSEKADAIWTYLKDLYNTNVGKGDGYWTALEGDITKYKDISTKSNVVDPNTIKRGQYDSKFTANYSSTVKHLGGAKYRVNTKGYNPDTTSKPVVGDNAYEGDYSNEFDIATGAVKAAWNMANFDKALQAGKGLSNSEILWQQHQLAAEEHYKADLDKSTKVGQAQKGLSVVKRDTVINEETQQTVYMAYPDGKKWTDEDKDWVPSQEEFKAILGTPNAKSSAFLLKDHLDQIEKTIDKITTTKSKGINIDLTAI